MKESIAFDRIPAERYDATRGGDARGADFAVDLAPHLVPGTVLEVGVGTGIMAGALARAGWSVFGVDLALPMLAKARGRMGPRVAAADARAVPVATGAVDNVLFCWVLHLVGDIPRAFAEAARVVRPGGRVVAVHGGPVTGTGDLDPAYARLAPLSGHRPDEADPVDAAAAAAGLRLVLSGETRPKDVSLSPAEMARNIGERVWSYLWRCTDEQWAAHVAPALDLLRAMPDQDRPRQYSVRHRYRGYERPA